MKVKINRSRFIEALKNVQAAACSKSVNPIYCQAKIEVSGNTMMLTTTNGLITLYGQAECVGIEDGSTTVPFQLMYKIINKLAEGDVEIDETNSNMKVKSGNACFKVRCIPSSQFPSIKSEDIDKKFIVPVATLRDLLNKTAYAQCTDDTRKTLTSVLLEISSDTLRCVASDGKRLAVAECAMNTAGVEDTVQYIIPQDSVTSLQRFLEGEGEVEISAMKTQVLFSKNEGKSKYYTRLIAGDYPKYENVIPADTNVYAEIDRNMLIDAVERVSVMATVDTASVKMTFSNGMLSIEVKGDDMCDAQDAIPIKYNGENIDIIFNPRYVLDPLRASVSDNIKVEMTDGMSAAVIRSCTEKFLCVLMPLRIAAVEY